MANERNPPERPRIEPEIIPPDRTQNRSAWRTHGFADSSGTHRIYVGRLGPFGGIVLLIALVVVAVILLLAFLGALLLWLPLLALIVVAAAIGGLLRSRRW